MAQWQNLTIPQIQAQIAECDKKIDSLTILLSQIIEATEQQQQNYNFLIPQVNQEILRWKALKDYLSYRLQQ